MRLTDRVNTDHVTLVVIEAAAVPASILWTLVVLSLAGGAIAAARLVAGDSGLPALAVDLLVGLLVILTAAVLVGTAGLAVRGYHRFYDAATRRFHPVGLAAVPALGLVLPYAYAATQLGTTELPWYLAVVVIFAAHILAFREIAHYSRRDDDRRTGVRLGSLAGVPAVVALVSVVTSRVIVGGIDTAGEAMVGFVAWTGVPTGRPLLAALPLVVAAGYYGWRLLPDTARERVPTPSRGLLRAAGRPAASPVGTLERARRHLPSLPSRSGSATDGSSWSGIGSRSSESTGSSGSSQAPPPSSPGGRRSRSRRSRGGSGSSGSGSGSAGSGSSARSANSRSSGGSSGSGSSSNGSSGRRSSSSSGGSSSRSKSSSRGSSSNGSSSGGSASGSSAGSSGGSTGGPPDDGEGTEMASDTRIFPGGFGGGGGGGGGNPVEICPDCDKDIPSDGVYEFCPFCGSEL